MFWLNKKFSDWVEQNFSLWLTLGFEIHILFKRNYKWAVILSSIEIINFKRDEVWSSNLNTDQFNSFQNIWIYSIINQCFFVKFCK